MFHTCCFSGIFHGRYTVVSLLHLPVQGKSAAARTSSYWQCSLAKQGKVVAQSGHWPLILRYTGPKLLSIRLTFTVCLAEGSPFSCVPKSDRYIHQIPGNNNRVNFRSNQSNSSTHPTEQQHDRTSNRAPSIFIAGVRAFHHLRQCSVACIMEYVVAPWELYNCCPV